MCFKKSILPFKLKGSLRYDEIFLFGILWVGDPQE
jgi:hypothetical protein